MRCQDPAPPIQQWKAYAGIVQIYRLHELVQRSVRVKACHSGQGGNRDAQKGGCRTSSEAGESQIEPHNIWLFFSDRLQEAPGIAQAIELPATLYRKSIQFGLHRTILVSQNGELDLRDALQFTGDMKPVLIQRVPARRERRYQTDFHCCPCPKIA